jgi:hypothetical protein
MQRIKLLFATSGDDRRTWMFSGGERREQTRERGESLGRLSASTIKATKHRIARGRAAVSCRRGPCRTSKHRLPLPPSDANVQWC